MTDKEKLEKVVLLADKMYTSMQNLTTDTTPIRKAMDEYRQFIIQHWNEEEPVSEDLEEAAIEYCGGNTGADARVRAGFVMGGNWQREQMIDKACEWLYQQQLVVDNMEKFIEDFRKAMED